YQDVLTAARVVPVERLPDVFNRRRLVELRDDRGAAGELEAKRYAASHAEDDAGDDHHPRQNNRVPAPAEEIEIGVVEDMHRRSSRLKASRPAAGVFRAPSRTASWRRKSR